MILDTLDALDQYAACNPHFQLAIDFLRRPDLASLEKGRYEIAGKDVYAMVDRPSTRNRDQAKLECHRRYIDVQYLIAGVEAIGWRALADCSKLDTPYDDEKDFMLYTDPSVAWIPLPPGKAMVFFPDDAHAPLVGDGGTVHKVVVKVAVTAGD